jgi:phosphatidylserine decarboxylase
MNTKHQTPVSKKNLNPDYAAKDATFDFPIYMSSAEKLGALELVVWDKDMLTKDYLGEVSLTLEDWFPNGSTLPFTDPGNNVSVQEYNIRINVPTLYSSSP